MEYNIDELFVADIVKVADYDDYNIKLYKSIFVLKDNEFFDVITEKNIPHATDSDYGQIACDNVYTLSRIYPNYLPAKNVLSKQEIIQIAFKINAKNISEDFQF